MRNEKYMLEARQISKKYGGIRALQDVSLTLRHNEILAIVGDNGAGKSTLLKIISGAVEPDSGTIFYEGERVNIRTPQDSMALGFQMCYQNLALIDCLSIPKNLFLGREITRNILGVINLLDRKKMRERSAEHLKNLGIVVEDIDQIVRNLSGGQRQVVAISRAVYWGKKLIILDEPTAALGVRESRKVLDLIGSLTAKDISIIIVSHNLQHVFSVADRIMVLRRGRNAGERLIKETDGDEVVKLITGAEFSGQELTD
jgi:simple sugar transport system ATP-binding protein